MSAKSLQLQIRVTARQKALLRRKASAAGLGMSEYVLARALPSQESGFRALIRHMGTAADHRPVLAELNDMLAALTPAEFDDATAEVNLVGLSSYLRNYLAAMTEEAAYQKNVSPPSWTRDVEPLTDPHFATDLTSLRAHLLRAAPVPFKRRNIFIDSSVGARV